MDTDLQMTRDIADANGKAALTLSLDSGSSRVAQLRNLDTESQVKITLLVFVMFCFVFAPSICDPLALCGGCCLATVAIMSSVYLSVRTW